VADAGRSEEEARTEAIEDSTNKRFTFAKREKRLDIASAQVLRMNVLQQRNGRRARVRVRRRQADGLAAAAAVAASADFAEAAAADVLDDE
jgi:hypothetical protein